MQFFYVLIESVSFLIGLFGLGVILTGSVKAAQSYLRCPDGLFRHERKILAEYLILGLDFLVCKDVIDTLLLDTGSQFWEDLAGLVIVVLVRIILTHYTLKELHDIVEAEKCSTPQSSVKPVRKKKIVKKR